jgi:hypothetical protein
MAATAFVLQPVDAALAWADVAGGQPGLERQSAALKLAGAVQSKVSGLHGW